MGIIWTTFYQHIWQLRWNEKFSEKHNFLKLTQETENLKNGVLAKKYKLLQKSVPTKKTLGIDDFTGEFYKTYKEDNNSSFIQTLSEYNIEEGKTKLNDLSEASASLIKTVHIKYKARKS